ncbi:MAG TPA: cell envelope integrity protein CreD, partial [Burkholderiaceae bacterium]|nr:cell envelope integrity protein CreD [Burkholderiaceae bacterium]
MRFPLLAKVAALAAVMLSLIWALDSVSRIVVERQGRLHEAQHSIAESLSTAQSLLGPVLQRACTETWDMQQGEGKDRKTVTERRDFVLKAVPRRLTVEATSLTEPRYRGIFRVNAYALDARLAAEWPDLNALQPRREHPNSRLQCEPPRMWVAVSDTRGIRSARITLQDHERDALPGTGVTNAEHAFQATWPAGVGLEAAPVRASIALELVGTEKLAFAPIGEATEVKLSSNWPHPSFGGRFLPAQREVREDGFDARWLLSSLASRAPQQLGDGFTLCRPDESAFRPSDSGKGVERCIETFGVSFIDPVSPYLLSDRATKYGLLFIALTFVAVALVEVMRRLRVHPVQYLLVGCALTLFFLLLVSLSEHIPFGWAYLAASAACTALLTFYGIHILRGARAGLVFGAGLSALYGALYVLLLREQSALVLGAVLLFT